MDDDTNSINAYLNDFIVGFGEDTRTGQIYRHHLDDFASWGRREFGTLSIEVFKHLEHKDIESYMIDRGMRGGSVSILNSARSAISSFYEYMRGKEIVSENPVKSLDSIKRPT